MGVIGIIIGIFGVIFISYKSNKLSYDNKPDSKTSIYLGLLSGALFGIAAVMFRGASLSLNLDNLLYSSGFNIVIIYSSVLTTL